MKNVEKPSTETLWDSKRLSEYFGISESSVSRHRASGENHPPYLRLSDHCVRYVPSKVVSWAERNSSAHN